MLLCVVVWCCMLFCVLLFVCFVVCCVVVCCVVLGVVCGCCVLVLVWFWFWTLRFSLAPPADPAADSFALDHRCTFGVLWLSCEAPAPRASKHHQNSTRRHPERDRKRKNGSGRGKKSEILGGLAPLRPQPTGPHPSGPISSRFGPHPLGHHHDTHQIQTWIGRD